MDKNDLISRSAAMEIVKRTSGDYAAAWAEIKRLPAVNPEELLNKAQIIWKERTLGGYRYTKCPECNKEVEVEKPITSGVPYCSRCGKRLDDRFMHYCPNCGAMMEG